MNKPAARPKGGSRTALAGSLLPWLLTGTVVVLLAGSAFHFYYRFTRKMIDLGGRERAYFYIHTGAGFNAVRDSLAKHSYLVSAKDFEWLARRKKYPDRVKPGRYLLTNGMRNNELVNLLRSGRQEPVRVTLQNIRTRQDLAGRMGRKLETDSLQLARLFNDRHSLARYGVTPLSLFTLFIPDTYEFYWNTSPDQLMERMTAESRKFWTPARRHRADSLGLSIQQVVILSSIVEKETNRDDEKPLIAGVYINRIRKGMALQADPTVVYAWNDFGIRRVTARHIRIDSPYNTYVHAGLPPGPICLPSVASIESVLNVRRHGYYYFCAREDFSGYHNFAATLDEHGRNARRYQRALDAMKIK